MVCELAPCHHQVMHLVMRALNHTAHEAERLQLDHLFGILTGHDEFYAIWQRLGPGVPAKRIELMHMSR